MPAASRKKAKKSAPTKSKKMASSRMASKAPSRSSKKAEAWHEKHYFMDEQEAFHKAHPNSKMLIMVFCVCVVVFFVVYYMTYLKY